MILSLLKLMEDSLLWSYEHAVWTPNLLLYSRKIFIPILFSFYFMFMAGAASQAGDADSSRAPGLTSGLQGFVNVHCGALLLVPQWQCISSFVFYFSPFDMRANSKLGFKEFCNKIGEWANSRQGESVSDLCRAKIRLGESKAVYSILLSDFQQIPTPVATMFIKCLNNLLPLQQVV